MGSEGRLEIRVVMAASMDLSSGFPSSWKISCCPFVFIRFVVVSKLFVEGSSVACCVKVLVMISDEVLDSFLIRHFVVL